MIRLPGQRWQTAPAAESRATPADACPAGLAVNPATGTLYKAETGQRFPADTVSMINAAACNARQHAGCRQTPAVIAAGPGPLAFTADPATNTLYVITGNWGRGPAALIAINGARCDAATITGCGQTPAAILRLPPASSGITPDPATGTLENFVKRNRRPATYVGFPS